MEQKLSLCWNEKDGTPNSDLFTFEEVANALMTGAFVGCSDVRIEAVPQDEQDVIWGTSIPWLEVE